MTGATQEELIKKLAKLEEDTLTCDVCFDVYKEPRVLPCRHVFCKGCLEMLPLVIEDGKSLLKCPRCREPVEMPPNGVAGFPVSTQTVYLIDFLKKKKAEVVPRNCYHCQSEGSKFCKDCNYTFCTNCTGLHKDCTTSDISGPPPPAPAGPTAPQPNRCLMHNEKFDTYCEKCQEMICFRCVQRVAPHTEHKSSCIPLKDALEKYRKLLEGRLKPISKEIDVVSTKLEPFSDQENKIAEQGNVVKATILSRVEFLIGAIKEREKELSDKVDKVVSSKLHLLEERRESIETTLEELQNLKEKVELCLKTGNQEELLKTKQWIPEIDKVINTDISKLKPTEFADLSFVPDDVSDNLAVIGKLLSTVETVDCDIEAIDLIDEGTGVASVLSIKYSSLPFLVIPLSSIKCVIRSPSSSKRIKAVVSLGNVRSQYLVKFHPTFTSKGTYELFLKIDGVEEEKKVPVPFDAMDNISIIRPKAAIKSVRKPFGIAVTKNKQIVVVTGNNDLVITDEYDKSPTTFSGPTVKVPWPLGWGNFQSTTDVAVTPDGYLLMLDQNCILKMTMDGRLVKTIGKKGSGNLQFNVPFGITVDQNNGKVYVAELYNHRIQVLNSDLTFSHTFGSEGRTKGKLMQPNGVALDSEGFVFVADTFNHRIQRFSPNGDPLFDIGSEGSKPGEFKHPEKLVIANDYIYVTEHDNSRISVFKTDGKFVRCFGTKYEEGGLVWPRGITLDDDGNLYVADYTLNRILKY